MTGQRPAQNSHGPAVDLFGDALAAVAQELARHLDPERKGLHISLIQQAVEKSGASIRGDARVTFGSALNKAQHRFVRVGTGTWAWKETGSTEGLSGTALLDEAYLVAKRLDPDRAGLHYETMKAEIQNDGARIAGGQPGNTLFSVLNNAHRWFEAIGDGLFRWR